MASFKSIFLWFILIKYLYNFILSINSSFFKLVQCQPQPNHKIWQIVVEGVCFNHTWPISNGFLPFQSFKRSSTDPKPPKEKVFQVPREKVFQKISKKKKLKFFLGFSLLGQETLDMGVFIYLMGSPDCEDLKKYMWEGYFRGTWNTSSLGGFGSVDDL